MDIDEKIEQILNQPKKVSTNAGSVENLSPDEIIKLGRYLENKKVKGIGVKMFRIQRPGTVD